VVTSSVSVSICLLSSRRRWNVIPALTKHNQTCFYFRVGPAAATRDLSSCFISICGHKQVPCLAQANRGTCTISGLLLVRLDWPILYSVRPSSLTPHFRPITTTTTLDWELRLAACICVCISPTDSKEIPGLGPGPGPELSAFCFSFFFFTLLPTLLPPHSPDPSTADYRSINSSVLRSPLST
jgi:hypothetical protein